MIDGIYADKKVMPMEVPPNKPRWKNIIFIVIAVLILIVAGFVLSNNSKQSVTNDSALIKSASSIDNSSTLTAEENAILMQNAQSRSSQGSLTEEGSSALLESASAK